MKKSLRIIAAGATLALAGAACGGDEPTGSGGTPTNTGTATNTSTPTGGSTSQSKFKSGTAKVQISGDINKELELSLDTASSVYNPPPAGFAVSWKEGEDTMGLGGGAQTGSRKTGSTLVFTLLITSEGGIAGISNKGECTVDITKSSNDGLEGTVTCDSWDIGGKKVNVKATFGAKP